MKHLFTIVLLSLSFCIFAQDYQLFNVNSKKVYQTNSDSAVTFSLAFDSVVVNNNSTIFYPIRNINFYPLNPGNCTIWGSCYQRNAPTWIGITVEKIGDSFYNFFNSNMEILHFNFNINPNGIHVFYEDDVQRFSYQYDTTIKTITIDGVIDSVKVYQIIHTTLDGNVIMSELHGREIIVGKELGLIKFFVINDFPELLVPLSLLGTNLPDVGLNKITYGDLYNYHPGDEIQYYEYNFWNNGPPFANYRRYTKQTYLERNETDNLLEYKVATEVFYIDSLEIFKDTIDFYYEKNMIIAEIPFEFTAGNLMINSSLKMVNHFGVNNWLYSEDNRFFELMYCADSNLWCKTENTYEYNFVEYELGLGLFSERWQLFYDRYSGKEVVFYKKDGVTHGTEAMVGINDLEIDHAIKIIPNPATNLVRLEGGFNYGSVACIKDLNGRYVVKPEKLNAEQVIDISQLNPGMYIVQVISLRKLYSGKLVIQ